MTTARRRRPLYQCQECGRRFYSERAAERAAFGDDGCPGCGGSDIDLYVETENENSRD